MSTSISVPCPKCGNVLRVPDHLLGTRVKCRFCEQPFLVEVQETPPARRAGRFQWSSQHGTSEVAAGAGGLLVFATPDAAESHELGVFLIRKYSAFRQDV